MDLQCSLVSTSVQCASGSSSGGVQVEPSTLKSIASGHIRFDFSCCQERVAVKCLTCLQQLCMKDAGGNEMRMTLRKGQQDKGVSNGYLISAEIPKAKQCRQLVCLSCVGRLLGTIKESSDGRQLLLSCRPDGGEDAILLQRQDEGFSWVQVFEVTNALIGFLTKEDERTATRKRARPSAATQIGERGAAKGLRANVACVPEAAMKASNVSSLHYPYIFPYRIS
jgi:hypothetical protein